MIRWHLSHKHLRRVGDGADYWGIRKMHIRNETIRRIFQQVENHCIAEIYKATNRVYHTEMATVTEWPIGGVQNPHLDTYSNQEMAIDPEYEGKIERGERGPSREWTCILYLNDDHGGGETYFPPSDYYPFGWQSANMGEDRKAGDGLLFQGIYHSHGVFPVRRKSRHTMALWFTDDIEKCATQNYIQDLSQDESSIKHHLPFDLGDTLFTKQTEMHRNKELWHEYLNHAKKS